MKIENINIRRTNGYGSYIITGEVNGVEVSASTNDSQTFDYLNDDEFPDKQVDAILHCELRLERAYYDQRQE